MLPELPGLETERLLLKGINPGFIHALFRARDKKEIMEFFGCDEAGYTHLRDMHDKGMETHRISHYFFLLLLKENKRPIGECGFHTWNKTHRRTEMFYLIRKEDDKNKGYMREAMRAVLTFGFGDLGLHRIEALVADWNVPSVKLLKHFGFSFEGTMREDYCVNGRNESSDCYSLLKGEWEKGEHGR
jgi:ribosomal-protein-alanine N-acetyltransferase